MLRKTIGPIIKKTRDKRRPVNPLSKKALLYFSSVEQPFYLYDLLRFKVSEEEDISFLGTVNNIFIVVVKKLSELCSVCRVTMIFQVVGHDYFFAYFYFSDFCVDTRPKLTTTLCIK